MVAVDDGLPGALWQGDGGEDGEEDGDDGGWAMWSQLFQDAGPDAPGASEWIARAQARQEGLARWRRR